MIKSMRSWNDLEAGIEGEDAVEAVVLDGEVDARVRVLAELVVHGEDPARPTADEGSIKWRNEHEAGVAEADVGGCRSCRRSTVDAGDPHRASSSR